MPRCSASPAPRAAGAAAGGAPGRPDAYDLHGIPLAVSGWEPAAAAIHARLERLPAARPGPHDADGIEIEIVAGEAAAALARRRPAGARPVYDPPQGEVVYADGEDLLYIEHGASADGDGGGRRLVALCEPAAGRARLGLRQLPEAGSEDAWYLSHPLFTVPLAEILKRRGLYMLHAAGVARDGRALLLPGTSGAGKSTLAVALVRAGLDLLGDDTLFLARGPEGLRGDRNGGDLRNHQNGGGDLRLLAFPDEIDLTPQSVGLLPGVAPLLSSRPGWQKSQLAAGRLEGCRIAWETRPAVLVFPRVAAGGTESRLTEIDPFEALLELAPNVLLTEPRSSQAHLDALGELAQASRCYRLETGRDLGAAAARLADLLA